MVVTRPLLFYADHKLINFPGLRRRRSTSIIVRPALSVYPPFMGFENVVPLLISSTFEPLPLHSPLPPVQSGPDGQRLRPTGEHVVLFPTSVVAAAAVSVTKSKRIGGGGGGSVAVPARRTDHCCPWRLCRLSTSPSSSRARSARPGIYRSRSSRSRPFTGPTRTFVYHGRLKTTRKRTCVRVCMRVCAHAADDGYLSNGLKTFYWSSMVTRRSYVAIITTGYTVYRDEQ